MRLTGTKKEKYQKIRQAAANAGDPHPDIVAAQWAIESNWGESESGSYNYFGIKAVGNEPYTLRWTNEVRNGRTVREQHKFKNYSSLDEGIKGRVDFIKKNKRYRNAGYFTAKNPSEAAWSLQNAGYATDPKYAEKLISIINSNGGDAGVADPNSSSVTPTDEMVKQKIEELKRRVDLDGVLLNLNNLEQHQVGVTWGSRLNYNEHSDWIGFKQYLLYLCKTYMPHTLIPLSELIPIFSMDGDALSTYQKITDTSRSKETLHDKLLNRYDNTSKVYNDLKSSGGIDLLTLDPFGEEENFKKTRGLSYKTIGNLTLNPGTDGSTLSKPGGVGVNKIKITEGDDSVMNQAYIEIEMEDIAGNKFLDPASPWSFILNYSTFGGDFLFRYGWQIRLPEFKKNSSDINSNEYKFWNHEGWKLFGEKLKKEFISKLKSNDYTVSLTQSLDPDALWYKGFIIVKEEGVSSFIRDLKTDEAIRSKYYMTLGMTHSDLKINSKTGSATAILSFMTTNTLANFMSPITQSANLKKLLSDIENSETNLFDLISAFFKDNQEYIKSTSKENQERFQQYYKDFTAYTNKDDICRIIQVIPIEDDGKGYSGNFSSKDPREVPIKLTDDLKKSLESQAGDNRKLWSWVRDVLHANNVDDVISSNNQTAYFTFVYDDRKSKKESESELLIQDDVQFAEGTGFLTEKSYKRIFTFDDVFSFRFQGSLVQELNIEKAEQETLQAIQAADNQASEITGEEQPAGTSVSTTISSSTALEQSTSISGTEGNKPTTSKPDLNTTLGLTKFKTPMQQIGMMTEEEKKNVRPNKYNSIEKILGPKLAGVESGSGDKLALEVIRIASGYIGTKEVPKNAGAQVITFLNSVGLGAGQPWCMAFVYYCFNVASQNLNLQNPLSKTGHCMTQWYTASPVLKSQTPRVGSVFIMSYGDGKGHTGIVTKVNDNNTFEAIEGNTNSAGSREGEGVWRKTRKNSEVIGFISISSSNLVNQDGSVNPEGQTYYNVYEKQVQTIDYGVKEDLLRYWLSTMRNTNITAMGHPWLQLSKGFFIKGTGYFDGRYFAIKIEHTIEKNQFTTQLTGVSVIFADSTYAETQANLNGETLKPKEGENKKEQETTAKENVCQPVKKPNPYAGKTSSQIVTEIKSENMGFGTF